MTDDAVSRFAAAAQTARTSASHLIAYSSSQQTVAAHAADACAAMSCAPSSRPAVTRKGALFTHPLDLALNILIDSRGRLFDGLAQFSRLVHDRPINLQCPWRIRPTANPSRPLNSVPRRKPACGSTGFRPDPI